MNQRTHFFIKIWFLTLCSWNGDVGCVWEMGWRRGQTAILTPSCSSTIAALISHLGWVAQPWVTEGLAAPSLQADSHAVHPLSNWFELPRAPGHVHLLPLFFRLFTQVHLLIDGSVKGQYITLFSTALLFDFKNFDLIGVSSSLWIFHCCLFGICCLCYILTLRLSFCCSLPWFLHWHLLYFDLRPEQTCHYKVMHRKEVTHSNGQ